MPTENTVVRSDSADASLAAAEEVVRELALRGNILAEAVEVLETMEETRPLTVANVYPSSGGSEE